MALVKLSDYYADENSTICDALNALSEATSVKLTDDADMYFDGSPCALGTMLAETTPAVAVAAFDDVVRFLNALELEAHAQRRPS
jgi:hypothetical protein